MKFREYIRTDYFRKEEKNVRQAKRMSKIGLSFGIVMCVFLVAAVILIDKEKGLEAWQNILAVCLFVAAVVIMIAICIIGAKYNKRDNNGNLRASYLIAFLLWSREEFASDWMSENGVVTFCLDSSQLSPGKCVVWLERGEERRYVLPDDFDTGEASDALIIVSFGLFRWMEMQSLTPNAVRFRLKTDGEFADKKWNFLYKDGKQVFRWKNLEYAYRRAKRLALRKGVIEK